jgi:hypothetical protein
MYPMELTWRLRGEIELVGEVVADVDAEEVVVLVPMVVVAVAGFEGSSAMLLLTGVVLEEVLSFVTIG